MTLRLRWIVLALGFAAGAMSIAQTGGSGTTTPPSSTNGVTAGNAPILIDFTGRVQMQVGGTARSLGRGRPILADGILTTDDIGNAVIRFPSGRTLSVGPNSSVVINVGHASGAGDAEQGEGSINLIEGSLRLNPGPGGLEGTGRLVLQVGTSTVSASPGVDLTVVTEGGQMVVSMRQGSAQVRTLSGESVQLGGGQAAFVNPNGGVQMGTFAQVDQFARQTAPGRALIAQSAELDNLAYAVRRRQSTQVMDDLNLAQGQGGAPGSRSGSTQATSTSTSTSTSTTGTTAGASAGTTSTSAAAAGSTGTVPPGTAPLVTANAASGTLPEVDVGLEQLPPTETIGPTLNLPALAMATTGTAATGAVAGGSPCTASCN